jgi:hypothetical protein
MVASFMSSPGSSTCGDDDLLVVDCPGVLNRLPLLTTFLVLNGKEMKGYHS